MADGGPSEVLADLRSSRGDLDPTPGHPLRVPAASRPQWRAFRAYETAPDSESPARSLRILSSRSTNSGEIDLPLR